MDRDWAASEMPQVFLWEGNTLRAQQAWHGYLVWGRWSDDFLERFLACYVDTFPHLRADIGKSRHQFCEHMAGIAIFSMTDPMVHGWLPEFVRIVDFGLAGMLPQNAIPLPKPAHGARVVDPDAAR